jgi:hypothetical protein
LFGKLLGDGICYPELGCGTIGGEQASHMAARIASSLDVLSANQRRDRIEKILNPFRPSRPFTLMVLENHDIGLVAIDQLGDLGHAFRILLIPGPLDAPVDRQSRSIEDNESDALNAGRNGENTRLSYPM